MIGEARSGALPQLDFTGGYDRYIKKPQIFLQQQRFTIGVDHTYTAGLALTQPLYAAGKVFEALKAARSETRSGRAELADLQEEIKLQVKKTYYQILLADRTIGITKKTLKQLTDQLATIKARFDKGLESDYTLMRQEVQVSNVEPELALNEQQRVVLENTLKVLLALPVGSNLVLTEDFVFARKGVPEKEELIKTAMDERKDIEASLAHIETLKRMVGIEKGGYLPTLNLVANLDWTGEADHWIIRSQDQFYTADASLQLSWPIFDGLKTHYRVKQARAKLTIEKNNNLRLKDNIESDVASARSKYLESASREAAQKKALTLAQKAVDISSLRFREGLTSQLELNDTILQRDQAEKLHAQAVYDCLDAEATLLRLVGGKSW
jgi:HAE1 family hydrophobic/amphiphilic exporter-1